MPTETAEVVIVGGGVVGAATAFFLTRLGVRDVLLLEKEGLACGATGVCPGGIRQQFSGEADCLLARRSMRFWNEINQILEPEDPFVFERSGYLFLADSEAQLDQYRLNVALQNRLGIPSEILTPEAVARLLPALRLEGVRGGAWCDEDGFLEDCHGVTQWMMRRAREAGAQLLLEQVLVIEPRPDGWDISLQNRRVACSRLVLATGPDTPKLTRPLGLDLPIRPLRRRLAFTEPVHETLMPPLVVAPERGFAGKQLVYGVFYLGWLRETEEQDDLEYLENGLSAGATLLPLLGELPVRRVLAGVYDQTPDSRPILGEAPGFPGLHLAAGFSGHGFMIAPAVGECLAQTIVGVSPHVPMGPFSPDRFQKGMESEGLVI